MKELTCFFTGHRNLPIDLIRRILMKLDAEIDRLIGDGVTDFISGGALGFDQIAASLIIAKKQMGRNIRLVLALPCRDQDQFWNERQRALYQNLLKEADEIIYISERYSPLCMKKRNRYMADRSAYCMCALLKERSGTARTVRYAHIKGIEVINVAL